MEHVVDRRQGDVLIGAAVAGDEMRIQQLVVIKARRQHVQNRAYLAIILGRQHRNYRTRAGGGRTRHRGGVMRDVGEEVAAGANREGRVNRHSQVALEEGFVARVGDAVRVQSHKLRQATRAENEIAVLVDRHLGYGEDVEIVELDAENVARLGLQDAPGRHAAEGNIIAVTVYTVNEINIVEQLAGGDGPFAETVAEVSQHIGAQEHLMRRVLAKGLVLVDERRVGVDELVDVVEALIKQGRSRIVTHKILGAAKIGGPG
ncbi:hypothetical protein MnTg02_01526 [bacterium MnTg02]|nr:hypothetical protein MnTg02_01526 [bacterium MnTg02]